ncbi:uncharacterized protein LOC128092602 [Culex pipiens pallens]|uniref:uncharacterized protein LOC128092602 n=1 Tax=Culex pipiens pallens TaxID=42434 RepID=UPI0022AAAF84|nr:uncharacterized protein LOC128092602 [Culex pipiens pallens]
MMTVRGACEPGDKEDWVGVVVLLFATRSLLPVRECSTRQASGSGESCDTMLRTPLLYDNNQLAHRVAHFRFTVSISFADSKIDSFEKNLLPHRNDDGDDNGIDVNDMYTKKHADELCASMESRFLGFEPTTTKSARVILTAIMNATTVLNFSTLGRREFALHTIQMGL